MKTELDEQRREQVIDSLLDLRQILMKYDAQKSNEVNEFDHREINKTIDLIDSFLQKEVKESNPLIVRSLITDVMKSISSLFM